MSQPQQQTQFIKDICDFVESSKNPNSIVSVVKKVFPENAKELDRQLETFASDMQKLEKGQMTYSEMRSLYG